MTTVLWGDSGWWNPRLYCICPIVCMSEKHTVWLTLDSMCIYGNAQLSYIAISLVWSFSKCKDGCEHVFSINKQGIVTHKWGAQEKNVFRTSALCIPGSFVGCIWNTRISTDQKQAKITEQYFGHTFSSRDIKYSGPHCISHRQANKMIIAP